MLGAAGLPSEIVAGCGHEVDAGGATCATALEGFQAMHYCNGIGAESSGA